MAAEYDLNEVFDALAEIWDGLVTGEEMNGEAIQIIAEPEVAGDTQVPAVYLELNDLTYDESMGGGADSFVIIATVLVSDTDSVGGQRALRSFLSRKPGLTAARLKTELEADKTLGGLVSYVHLRGLGRFGRITYDNVAYLGAELIIEGMS